MLVRIDENSAALTPFGSLARHIPAQTKSWSGTTPFGAFSDETKAFPRNSRPDLGHAG